MLINIDIIDYKNIVVDPDSNYTIIYLYKDFVFIINCKPKVGYTVSISIYTIQ